MRRHQLLAVLVAFLAVAAIVGCATPDQPRPADLPDFYLNPPVAEDAFYGVGSAQMASLDNSRRMALSRAREDIAFQIQASVEAAIIDYSQEAGADDNTQVLQFVETISRQITDTTLNGIRTEEVAQSDDGTMYALVSLPMNNFGDAAADAFSRNEDAAFSQFQAQQALEYLDSQLEEDPPQSSPVEE